MIRRARILISLFALTLSSLVLIGASQARFAVEPPASPSTPVVTSGATADYLHFHAATAQTGTVDLTWTPPASDGGSPLTGYKLYRGTTSGGETLVAAVTAPATSFTDSGLANGVTYYYQLTAVNAIGEGPTSNELSATTAAPITVPDPPTLTAASPGNATVSLTWTPPGSNGSNAITGYKVYRSTTSGTETLLTTIGTVTSFTDTGLTNGNAYYYKVSAVNAAGESSLSNELRAGPATVPSAAILDSATAGTASVALAWSKPASSGGSSITGYRIYRSSTSGAETLLTTLASTATTYTDSGLASGSTYYYKVAAVNAKGTGALSNEKSAITAAATITVPDTPALTSASPGNATVSLTWTAPGSNGRSSITNYRIYRATSSGAETLLTTIGNVSSFTDTGLTNGNAYYYKISAVNAVGESGLSNELRAGPATVPSIPTLNAAAAGNASIALSWSKPSSTGGSSITGYKVYRSGASGSETLLTTLTTTATTYTDTAVTNGSTFYYKVAAVNAKGTSALSNELSATPVA